MLRIAIAFRQDLRAVHVHDGAYLGQRFIRSMDCVVDRQEMFGGERVRPLDLEWLTSPDLERRPGPHAVVSPHAGGWEVAMRFVGNSRI